MNVNDYTSLLNKPDTITEQETLDLSLLLDRFPYLQSARALQLKGLYNHNSFKYNFALKVTAAHTTDRAALFEFITATSFNSFQKIVLTKSELDIMNINVVDSEVIEGEKQLQLKEQSIEQSILTSIAVATSTAVEPEEVIEKLQIGEPLDFTPNEKHSFQEWLQLSKINPIDRDDEAVEKNVPEEYSEEELEEKKKKASLIDRFIKTSPKISPVKNGAAPVIQIDINKDEHSYLMTETLAKVYLEQKKYQKAIQAYDILILKYPEKSSFFADRISDIKILQQNNN
ncbi:tetratricopeptide repeat protein [Flavobacterium frigidarium]|uniref:tetratricopeptide repeat protein n=1 Tax=Flavobacterium frigidarium TaxID=99286 RepID=UPI0030D81D62|tara:strand:+ start:9756 stop:10613 length:858 start_codon:yes stop_codon:yes gene_type:complete